MGDGGPLGTTKLLDVHQGAATQSKPAKIGTKPQRVDGATIKKIPGTGRLSTGVPINQQVVMGQSVDPRTAEKWR
jgi:hypothetical protein